MRTLASAPREAARSARRAALLAAAEQVFAERTFSGATMAEIAARAGYSAGNLYNVFESKAALYQEILNARGELFVERLVGALESGGPVRATIDRYIDAVLRFVEDHRDFFIILSQPTGMFEWGTGASAQDVDGIRERIERAIDGLFATGVERGELPPAEPLVYSSIVHGALSAYLSRWIRHGGDPTELWKHLEELREAIHRALGATS
ncbi:MAG: TetR/AcrR family transcriptional regulator [Myxococcota bacterium]